MLWTDSGDWTSDNGLVPSPVDSVVFGPYNTWSTYTVNLPTGTTTVNNLSNESMWTAFNFTNASATLDVTGNFADSSGYANTFAPVLNLTGQLINPYVNWASCGSNGSNTLTFSNSGNTIGGGINSVDNEIIFTGNNNTINGGITITGMSPASYTLNWGFGRGGLLFTGSGNAFGGAFNLERDGYVIMQQTANLSNVTAINFNGGVLELEGAGNTFNSGLTNLDIASGTLIGTSGSNALSAYTGIITLGGGNDYGTLSVNATVSNNITLAGAGGQVTTGTLSGSITGSAQLVKVGTARPH